MLEACGVSRGASGDTISRLVEVRRDDDEVPELGAIPAVGRGVRLHALDLRVAPPAPRGRAVAGRLRNVQPPVLAVPGNCALGRLLRHLPSRPHLALPPDNERQGILPDLFFK